MFMIYLFVFLAICLLSLPFPRCLISSLLLSFSGYQVFVSICNGNDRARNARLRSLYKPFFE